MLRRVGLLLVVHARLLVISTLRRSVVIMRLAVERLRVATVVSVCGSGLTAVRGSGLLRVVWRWGVRRGVFLCHILGRHGRKKSKFRLRCGGGC
jgi:hypothetical protein